MSNLFWGTRRDKLDPMPNERPFIAVYIVTNMAYGTLYVGVTSDLYRRIRQHRAGTFEGFTKEHGLSRLVWFEPFGNMTAAIKREKAIKRYLRDWKINLIERDIRAGTIFRWNGTRPLSGSMVRWTNSFILLFIRHPRACPEGPSYSQRDPRGWR